MKSEVVAEKFAKGFDCSQVVVEHFAEEVGLSKEVANKISACFGGGMSRGETCGAVVGALMILGMRAGQYDENHMEQKEIMEAKREEFYKKFLEKYPSCICKNLLGYDITKTEELQKIVEKGLLTSFCPQVVTDVIEILEDMHKK
jgi:C_GCAxxG_C_C family probable redox protein